MYPVFTAADLAKETESFKSMGFRQKHHRPENDTAEICVMESDSGSRVDLAHIPGAAFIVDQHIKD